MRPLAVAVSGIGLVDPSTPVIVADDEGFARGRAAFTTLRVYGGRPFRLQEHLERLASSAARIGLPSPDAAEVEALGAWRLSPPAGAADCTLAHHVDAGPAGRAAARPRGGRRHPGVDRRGEGSRAATRLAARAAAVGAVAAGGDEVDELRGEHGRRGRGEATRRGRRGVRRRRRHRARRAGHERLVARGRRARDAVARPRHPRRRDARDAHEPRGRARVHGRGGRLSARAPARRRRGVHVVVRPRGPAGRRRRRRTARARAGRRRAPGRVCGGWPRAADRPPPQWNGCEPSTTRCAHETGSSAST